ncbi:LysR substrate-binding domain-containing protein [Roseomonas populi]|uniref:LysR substrate-binding domain-containing protein n=1 Tax=Roseomonas populi TaxID=3121582 RepID=A0ABT1XA44_9PROT|nr:LysR substrate-binding domain-containing protein [Roseomonas pecuniae]MCR0984982.1 LysR substrate-binding domain-containing protein [Roseomonas pecuniae]
MTLDLRQLRYFVAVAEEGHITRAAERLGMAQPPLSQQIKALEDRLGLRLFHRKARGVELTEGGAALLEEARIILARLEQAERSALSAARGEQGQLRVGVAPTAPFHPFVPRVIRAFREAFPGVTLTMEECLSRQAVAGLKDARLDVAFVRAEIEDAELTVHRLIREPMVVALPAAHSLAAPSTPSPLAAFAGETFIAFARQEGPGIFDATAAACLRAGFSPHIGQEAPRITSTLGLVAVGLGIAIVPASMRHVRMDGVAYRELVEEDRPAVPLDLALRRGGASAAIRNFTDLVRRAAREHAIEAAPDGCPPLGARSGLDVGSA